MRPEHALQWDERKYYYQDTPQTFSTGVNRLNPNNSYLCHGYLTEKVKKYQGSPLFDIKDKESIMFFAHKIKCF